MALWLIGIILVLRRLMKSECVFCGRPLASTLSRTIGVCFFCDESAYGRDWL